jgi:diacylglycerol kinase
MSRKIAQLRLSVKYALSGVKYVFMHEQNFRIQIYISLVVILMSYVLGVRKYEFIVLLLLIFSVLTLELVNSSLEKFFDIVNPRLRHHVQVAKDIMAGAVLLTSVLSVIIGVLIFWPYV